MGPGTDVTVHVVLGHNKVSCLNWLIPPLHCHPKYYVSNRFPRFISQSMPDKNGSRTSQLLFLLS